MRETWYSIPGCPVSIALLADLHNGDPSPVLASLDVNRPRMIAIAGDLLYGSQPEGDELVTRKQKNALRLVRGCADIAPTFISLGNHEWMLCAEDVAFWTSLGATVLDNTWTEITLDGRRIVVGGLTCGYVLEYRRFLAELSPSVRAASRYPTEEVMAPFDERIVKIRPKPEAAWLEDYSAVSGYHILLCHHPEYLNWIPLSLELICSGHAHGGQWRVFDHGIYAPGQGFWPKLTSGVVDGRMVISRGLGNTRRIPRINNPPEVVYIEPV